MSNIAAIHTDGARHPFVGTAHLEARNGSSNQPAAAFRRQAGVSRETHIFPPRKHPLDALEALAMVSSVRRGQEICSQGRPAENWCCLISGVARRSVMRADGRRQIVDLLLPGDFFGFTVEDEYDFTVEAVTQASQVASYPRRRTEMLADSDPRLSRELRQVAFESLSRLQSQLMIVGRITALEKVGSFILEMAARLSDGRDSVVLPVSRYDIADYLAVSVETVSRSLTDLKQRGVISLSGTRKIKIVNRGALEEGE